MAELFPTTTFKKSPPSIWFYVSVEEDKQIVAVTNAAMHVTVKPAHALDAKTEEIFLVNVDI